ncbi:hypothetical protein ABZ860_20815 [Microbispora sp. NPDC046973]|nr:hypothetical protein [Microbispora sitophila]
MDVGTGKVLWRFGATPDTPAPSSN